VQDQKPAQDPKPAEERADVEQHGLAELREMQAQGEHLEETIEDARDAVQAAHNANSMRSPGSQGYDAEEEGPQASG
jgi:hypothetical protein